MATSTCSSPSAVSLLASWIAPKEKLDTAREDKESPASVPASTPPMEKLRRVYPPLLSLVRQRSSPDLESSSPTCAGENETVPSPRELPSAPRLPKARVKFPLRSALLFSLSILLSLTIATLTIHCEDGHCLRSIIRLSLFPASTRPQDTRMHGRSLRREEVTQPHNQPVLKPAAELPYVRLSRWPWGVWVLTLRLVDWLTLKRLHPLVFQDEVWVRNVTFAVLRDEPPPDADIELFRKALASSVVEVTVGPTNQGLQPEGSNASGLDSHPGSEIMAENLEPDEGDSDVAAADAEGEDGAQGKLKMKLDIPFRASVKLEIPEDYEGSSLQTGFEGVVMDQGNTKLNVDSLATVSDSPGATRVSSGEQRRAEGSRRQHLGGDATPPHPAPSTPKLAFLFLTRGPIPLAPLWSKFFAGHESRFSLYIHTAKNYTAPRGSLPPAFQGRHIPSEEVQYATMSVVDAERRLFAQALLDPDNQRFILVSESCIPLFNFTVVYDYLMGTNKSFVRGSNYPGPDGTGRWHEGFLPLIRKDQFLKGSQWIVLERHLATAVIQDTLYYGSFKKNCFWHKTLCCPDEHYIHTALHALYPESLESRSLTWVAWEKCYWHCSSHPRTFGRKEVSAGLIEMLRGNNLCLLNKTQRGPCNLFARKFKPDTLDALLQLSTYLGF